MDSIDHQGDHESECIITIPIQFRDTKEMSSFSFCSGSTFMLSCKLSQ